jgi:hypothetical protein
MIAFMRGTRMPVFTMVMPLAAPYLDLAWPDQV